MASLDPTILAALQADTRTQGTVDVTIFLPTEPMEVKNVVVEPPSV